MRAWAWGDSGRVLWLVVWCAGMYVGGCHFIVGLPVRLSEGGDLFGKPHACLFGASLNLLSANECGGVGLFAANGAWLFKL